jgi:hypothetical protein
MKLKKETKENIYALLIFLFFPFAVWLKLQFLILITSGV